MKNNIDYSLYLVTDREVIGNRNIISCVEEALIGGVTIVQIREKNTSTKNFYNIAIKIKEVTDKYKVPLIINDRLDIALAINADGLHVGQSDMPTEVVRQLLGPDKILGVSAATMEEALKAQRDGADYIGVGAVFPTSNKNDARIVSLDLLRNIKKEVKIPVVAIGGINQRNIVKAMETGVDGVAVISAILSKENIADAARNLKKKWQPYHL
ncbi:thiamine-phosphate pyrophosphorylase [Fervidicella metallireducens AeB]|uniref:Thiamine-phosphate synthase n=1 Tax=Fervidicella metallireducens AeB TaxID=1403537 RepID=A0A017RWF0_9CLOT|nr:thiamine phosphate synthase [Fervidicella metallireducens]EYE88729.1 thiamine-phosphate pyrophosphorylase [Fervidicella metallireducens AeB]